jgi:ribonuclease R
VEKLGDTADPRSISLIAIHTAGIPTVFPPEAIALAEGAQPVQLGERTDLRELPLVTIDGADARDFDDAVWAEPDGDPANEGGWHIVVAIADVSWYVRPGDALDEEARRRGNSVYFPDRVVPMLPEALSNELCSLKPDVERACLAVHMWLDKDGRKLRHRFVRGLMRSVARLTYEQVQKAADGRPDAATKPLADGVIRPLYGAYGALDRERRKRGTLELDLPELRVVIGGDGHVEGIAPRARLDSHKLIEEFMIAANVAAAETLEQMRQPCMYRVHDAPDPARVEALRQFVEGLEDAGLTLPRGQSVRPRQFNQLLRRAEDTPYRAVVNELVLRSQAQAVYAPVNIGHFGLALKRYAHFTSPIRRYADLLVHRALVAGCRFGEGGLPPVDPADFAATGEHISETERRAAGAERSAIDRYVVAFLADKVGATFAGRIVGGTRAGLFVRLTETAADGLVPMGSLPGDFYVVDENRHRLVGRRWAASTRSATPSRHASPRRIPSPAAFFSSWSRVRISAARPFRRDTARARSTARAGRRAGGFPAAGAAEEPEQKISLHRCTAPGVRALTVSPIWGLPIPPVAPQHRRVPERLNAYHRACPPFARAAGCAGEVHWRGGVHAGFASRLLAAMPRLRRRSPLPRLCQAGADLHRLRDRPPPVPRR